jgi:hypothetical protein
MKIKKKFLQLTRFTYPYGVEEFLESHLPSGVQKDEFGNYFISIGENYTTMFTCHLDTACSDMKRVIHQVSSDGKAVRTDGTTILGADDKAGMVVILYMIEKKIPGLYYFFIGEEVGCIGSRAASSAMEKGNLFEGHSINKVVSFDRRGTTSVITDQFYGNCCSNEFAISLCSELNKSGLKMVPDDTGVLTDSAQFMDFIPECTNISVGYYNEHTVSEWQNLEYLYQLCNAVSKVDWESLPVERDPKNCDNWYNDFWGGGSDNDFEWPPVDDEPVDEKSSSVLTFSGESYSYISGRKAYISEEWIKHEKKLIKEYLEKNGYKVDRIYWDGTSCWLTELGETMNQYIGNRSDMIPYINNFDVVPIAHIRYSLPEVLVF